MVVSAAEMLAMKRLVAWLDTAHMDKQYGHLVNTFQNTFREKDEGKDGTKSSTRRGQGHGQYDVSNSLYGTSGMGSSSGSISMNSSSSIDGESVIDWDRWRQLKVQGRLSLPFDIPLAMLTRRYVQCTEVHYITVHS